MNLINDCLKDSEAIKKTFMKRYYQSFKTINYKDKIEKLNDYYEKTMDDYINGIISKEECDRKSIELKEKIEQFEIENKKNKNQADIILFERRFARFMEYIQKLPEDKIETINAFVKRINITKKDKNEYGIEIMYLFE